MFCERFENVVKPYGAKTDLTLQGDDKWEKAELLDSWIDSADLSRVDGEAIAQAIFNTRDRR